MGVTRVLLVANLIVTLIHLHDGAKCIQDKKKICYESSIGNNIRMITTHQQKIKLFGVLLSSADAKIEQLHPFSTPPLPNPRAFGSRTAIQNYFTNYFDLIKKQYHLLTSPKISSVFSSQLRFPFDEGLTGALVFGLHCNGRAEAGPAVDITCRITLPELDGQETRHVTFQIHNKAKFCKVYLKNLGVMFKEKHLYVVYGSFLLGEEMDHFVSQGSAAAASSTLRRSQFLVKCTEDTKCHPLLLNSIRGHISNLQDKCDHDIGCCKIAGNPYAECRSFAKVVFYKMLQIYYSRGTPYAWAKATDVSGRDMFRFLVGDEGIHEIYQDVIEKDEKKLSEDGTEDVLVRMAPLVLRTSFDFQTYVIRNHFNWFDPRIQRKKRYFENEDRQVCFSLPALLQKLKKRIEEAIRQDCNPDQLKAISIGVSAPCITNKINPSEEGMEWLQLQDLFDAQGEIYSLYRNHFVLLTQFPDGSVIGFNSGDVGLIFYNNFDEFWDVHLTPRLYEEVFGLNKDKFFIGTSMGSINNQIKEALEDKGMTMRKVEKVKELYSSFKKSQLSFLTDAREKFVATKGDAFYGFINDYQRDPPDSQFDLQCFDFGGWEKPGYVNPTCRACCGLQ